jgi:3-oxoacyl-[acyl-carrier protein] reductase
MSRFEGRGVLISGGSRGVGRALVEAFAAEGADVTFTFVEREDDARDVVKAVAAAGGRASAQRLDVRDPEATRALVDAVAAEGPLDVVVANAAITRDAFGVMLDPADFADVVDVNLRGAFHLVRSAARTMMAADRQGAIVTIGSVAGLRAHPGQVAYAAAKAGLVAMTRTLARELAPRGLRLNAVVGGLLDTGMASRMDHRAKAALLEHVPLGRAGRAEELARATLFLASPEASYIVGHALVVDGGVSL